MPLTGRRLYGTEHWRRRSLLQRRLEPLCRRCLEQGRVTPAQEAHHLHGFTDANSCFLGPLASLCTDCHAIISAEERGERRHQRRGYDLQFGADGWPIDPRHPVNISDEKRRALLRRLEERERADATAKPKRSP